MTQQAAADADHDLQIESGFRTYEEQKSLYAKYKTGTGNKAAQAGYSNHQNGIALDLNTKGFDTALYLWMKDHAPSYGYIRTVSKEHWHWEYHSTEAAEMAKSAKFKRAGVSPQSSSCLPSRARCAARRPGPNSLFPAQQTRSHGGMAMQHASIARGVLAPAAAAWTRAR